MGIVKPILRFFVVVVDVTSLVFVTACLGLPQHLMRLVGVPLVKAYEMVTFYGFGYIICPLWMCGRIGMFLYHLRRSSVTLNKKTKNRNEIVSRMIAKLCGLKTPMANAKSVIGLTLPQLRQRIVKQKDINALDVLEAFQFHAVQLLESNAGSIAEIIYDADVTAIIADHALEKAPLSLIHGIPIVLSNNIAVKGEDCNGSIVFKSNKLASHDSAFVSMLKTIGAVPYLLSNQAPIYGDMLGYSRLYGQCKHPTHPNRAVGGSCSGAAVLLSEKASVLGFGVDVLGDVRIPAANCGSVAFRPTSHRLSKKGLIFAIPPPRCVHPSVSLLASSVDSISDALTSLCTEKTVKFDPTLPCIPFQPMEKVERLTIGIYTSLPGLLPAVPAVERMMEEVKSALEKMGHTVVEFHPPRPEELMHMVLSDFARNEEYWKFFVSDNFANSLTYSEVLKVGLPKVPHCLRLLVGFFLGRHEGAFCALMNSLLNTWRNPLSASKVDSMMEKYRIDFFEQWQDAELDLLIGPPSPSPALLNNSPTSLNIVSSIAYSLLASVVDCPAGVLPFGRVSKADVEAVAKDSSSSLEGQLLRQQAGSEGLPLAVQIISQPWADDLALAIMAQLEPLAH